MYIWRVRFQICYIMNLKTYLVRTYIKNVIVKIPLLQFHQIYSLQEVRVTSNDFDVRNDKHKIKNL
jgi:hypothetical protein